jgi:hypothetical protein
MNRNATTVRPLTSGNDHTPAGSVLRATSALSTSTTPMWCRRR